jgi:pimeloyl-ACP methyl ester carboxylesterase
MARTNTLHRTQERKFTLNAQSSTPPAGTSPASPSPAGPSRAGTSPASPSPVSLYELPFPETVRLFQSSGGVTVPTYDWGGDGPPLIFSHATGLHARAYAPLAQRLRSHFHCYGVDVRGQGGAGTPTNGSFHWDGIADDFTAALDGLKLSGRGDVYGIGHSQGGYSILQGAILRPRTFAGLFGFEPVVFDIPQGTVFRDQDNVMAQRARKRREVFESRESAYENYKAKPPFSLINDDALRAYVRWGFDDLDDGTVRLKCRAAVEAELFSGAQTKTIHHLHEIECRVTLGLSGNTSANFTITVPEQHSHLKHGTLMHFPTRTHFGLLEEIDEMANIIAEIFRA